MAKKKPNDDLDTETTFVDMNVDGFSWYDPAKKNNKGNDEKTVKRKVSRKEYWQMVGGAFLAILPYILVVSLAFGVVVLIAYLWVG